MPPPGKTFDPRDSNMIPAIAASHSARFVDHDVLSAQLAPETAHSTQDTYDLEALEMRYAEYQSRRALEEVFESSEFSCLVI
jgi:hypothetical protein